jgi:hypothetical protein
MACGACRESALDATPTLGHGSGVEEADGEEWSWRTGRGELSRWYDEVRALPVFAARLVDAAPLSDASTRLYSSRFGNEGEQS